MPAFKRAQVPPGALLDLLDALHHLHLLAGHPSTRTLASDIGRGVASHTSIHKAFSSAGLPSWGLVELVVEAMARRAKMDDEAEVKRIKVLWMRTAGEHAPTNRPSASAGPQMGTAITEDHPPFARSMAETMPEVLNEIESLASGRSFEGIYRIPTGFEDLDLLLGGWSRGSLIVVGGRPSSGKTTLLLDFCRAASIKSGIATMFVSAEMNSGELQLRLLSAEARVPLHSIRTGLMGNDDWSRLAHIIAAVAHAPIQLGSSTKFELAILRQEVSRLVRESGLKLLLVDGLQSIVNDTAVGLVSPVELALRDLKSLAESLVISIIVSVQAERSVDGHSRRIEMQSIRDSSSVERVSDVIVLIDRPDQDDPESPRAGEADFIVAKNRNGPLATVTVAYQGHYSRFVDLAALGRASRLFAAETAQS